MWKEKFIAYLRFEKNYSSHTEISYLNDLNQFETFIVGECGEFDPGNIDSDLIRTWIAQLMEEGMKPRSVNRKLSAVKSFFKYLKKQGVITRNPAERVGGPKVEKKLPVFVSDKDMERILDDENEYPDDFEGHRDRFIMELFYVTGIRRSELIGLKDSDIDFYNHTLRVTGKRNKQRLIPLSDMTIEKLNEYIRIRDANVKNKSTFLFVKNNGEPMNPVMVYKVINTHLSGIATLTKKSPHVLRHSFATEMLNNGAEINAVKELLGHSSLASTEIYTHVTFDELKKVYKNAHPRAKK
ncbi:site-specific tyrosine recombinase/integron integrase [Anaerorudis cellulosivorans]|uniref:site-specific tyrosine recombinase/integron integrase n=1 Tax=Anaerorudis cellulosivorans TaxID=3397862 RepID=UPI00221F1F39|nr:site-specific tyrosine recombinase/integron integrase [Seramator thermalis]MCW1734078.1 tyrosine recombinase XerC [Seramator thermalis]